MKTDKLKKKRNCDGCRALDTLDRFSIKCSLGYSIKVEYTEVCGGNFVLVKGIPQEVCEKPATYKQLNTLRLDPTIAKRIWSLEKIKQLTPSHRNDLKKLESGPCRLRTGMALKKKRLSGFVCIKNQGHRCLLENNRTRKSCFVRYVCV